MKTITLIEARKIKNQTVRLDGVIGMIVSVDAAISLARERGLSPIITVGGMLVVI